MEAKEEISVEPANGLAPLASWLRRTPSGRPGAPGAPRVLLRYKCCALSWPHLWPFHLFFESGRQDTHMRRGLEHGRPSWAA